MVDLGNLVRVMVIAAMMGIPEMEDTSVHAPYTHPLAYLDTPIQHHRCFNFFV